MKGKELTKTFIMISNWKNRFDFLVHIELFKHFKGLTKNVLGLTASCRTLEYMWNVTSTQGYYI